MKRERLQIMEETIAYLNKATEEELPSYDFFRKFFYSSSWMKDADLRIEALLMYFEKIRKENKRNIDFLEKDILESKKYGWLKYFKEELEMFDFIIKKLEEAKTFDKEDSYLEKDEIYKTPNWNNAYFADTLEGAGYEMKSNKSRIYESNKKETMLSSIAILMSGTLSTKEDFKLFVIVKPSFGRFKGCHLYMPIEDLK